MRGGPNSRASRLLTTFDRMSRAWVKKIRTVSLITVHSGGHGCRGVDTWVARSALPFPLRSEWPRLTVIFQSLDKNISGEVTVHPTLPPPSSSLRSAAVASLAHIHSQSLCCMLSPWVRGVLPRPVPPPALPLRGPRQWTLTPLSLAIGSKPRLGTKGCPRPRR
jgi:hypothetical protein